VWCGLVAAGLAGAFFSLRWLWRRVKELMTALAEAADALAGAAVTAADWRPQPIPEVAIFADRADLNARRVSRLDRIARRRARRRAANQAVYDSWAVLAGRKDA
jgi:hypothetical protein